jgi:D-psicose/D-tagatose/L-ribulose 3-epimerase
MAFEHNFNSANMPEARNRSFDLVVFCAVPAAKWLANKEPDADLKTLLNLRDVLASIECKQLVLVSTIDIYQPPDAQRDEDAAGEAAETAGLHAYGKHRAMFESFVRELFPAKHTILRLPALFGIHLRKNYVYDMLRGNNLDSINRNTAFQWYDISRLPADMLRVLQLGLREVNLFPEPVATQRLIDLIADHGSMAGNRDPSTVGSIGPAMCYDSQTKYGLELAGRADLRYICTADEVCEDFKQFLIEWNMFSRTTVSCIAWQEADNAEAVRILKLRGYRYIEVAPTRFLDWPSLEAAHAGGKLHEFLAPFVANMRTWGLGVSSLQAIMFNKPDLVLFGSADSRQNLIEHVKMVMDFAEALRVIWREGGRLPIVFGAPKNRQRPESMAPEEADRIFCNVFSELATYAADRGCVICVEPNAPQYACNFINTSAEAKSLIERINHPGLCIHLDAACMTMAGENLGGALDACKEILGHVHVSEPMLANYLDPKVDHKAMASGLAAIKYGKAVSLELLCKSVDDLDQSLEFYEQEYKWVFATVN